VPARRTALSQKLKINESGRIRAIQDVRAIGTYTVGMRMKSFDGAGTLELPVLRAVYSMRVGGDDLAVDGIESTLCLCLVTPVAEATYAAAPTGTATVAAITPSLDMTRSCPE
jgi:hypothetical protein